jgi:hypothetical protein
MPSILPHQPAKSPQKGGMIRCCESVVLVRRPLSNVSSRANMSSFPSNPPAVRLRMRPRSQGKTLPACQRTPADLHCRFDGLNIGCEKLGEHGTRFRILVHKLE